MSQTQKEIIADMIEQLWLETQDKEEVQDYIESYGIMWDSEIEEIFQNVIGAF